ncbi:MAG: VOC family protein [Sinobacteraceae bacterium]|nr:VOC family protein [Nevskia sp.]MDI3260529.1 VOC family protein [Nevskiaceae bacterium]
MAVQPYLMFEGRCEEALEFYRKALGAEVTMLMRFGEAPIPADQRPPGSERKIIHAAFRAGGSELLASDGHCSGKSAFGGFSLTLSAESDAQAKRWFEALAEGGEVRMPLGPTFFATSFGMLADRFGVPWMVIHAKPKP